MIPIQDVIPTRLVPVATYVLLGLNLASYLSRVEPATGSYAAGIANETAIATAIDVVRSTFSHSSLLHFAINALFLWLFGGTVEDQLGRLRFAILYLVAGVAAAGMPEVVDPAWRGPTLGGSLAIAAVMGAYFFLFPNSKVLMLMPIPIALHEVPAAFLFAVWCAAQFFGLVALVAAGDAPDTMIGLALAAYALAFVIGAALCLALRRPERSHVEWWEARR